MTPAERHHELDRLRTLWTDAIHLVRAARPGTTAWADGRLLERNAAAAYMNELVDPSEDTGPAGPSGPPQRRIVVHPLPAGEALELAEELGRTFAAGVAANDDGSRPDVRVPVKRATRA